MKIQHVLFNIQSEISFTISQSHRCIWHTLRYKEDFFRDQDEEFLSRPRLCYPTVVCHLVVVVGLMHRWPEWFLIWRTGAN